MHQYDATASSVTPLRRGSTDQNPRDIALPQLLWEDFQTYDRDPLQPGLWAVLVHRFGNWRMGVRSKWLRAPLTLAYRAAFEVVHLGFGIHIGHAVKLGRRVRIWHHGGIFVNARSIGDDVQLRHNVSMGIASRQAASGLPIIEDGVDIYAGACIAGEVCVGRNSIVGANSVVVADVPPNTTVIGNPARRVPNAG